MYSTAPADWIVTVFCSFLFDNNNQMFGQLNDIKYSDLIQIIYA